MNNEKSTNICIMGKKHTAEANKLKAEINKAQFLRVLIVGDSEDDALLIIRNLEKGGYNPVYERVKTAAAMKKALEEKPWDIILCDYKMPKFKVPSAVALLKETNIDIPLIIVSGAIGEETAVEGMRSGAHDYIMKGNLSRLCPAIARELKEAEDRVQRRLAEETIQKSETRYHFLFDNMLNGFAYCRMIFDQGQPADVLYLDVNKSFELLTGLKNVVGKKFSEVLPGIQELDPELFEIYARVSLTGNPEKLEFHSKALKQWLSLSVSSPEKEYFVAVFDIITEHKQADDALCESEFKYKSLIGNVPDIIFTIDLEGKITFVNQRIKEILGYENAETINRKIFDFIPEEDHQRALENLQKGMKGEKVKHLQMPIIAKSGKKLLFESYFSRIYKDGEVVGAQGTAVDITEREEAQKRQELINRILSELNSTRNILNLIQTILLYIKDFTGIEAIGIRLREGEDFPYYETKGFPEHFIEAEKCLCERNGDHKIIRDAGGNPYLECMCGNIIRGRTNPSLPFFTKRGSFWSNNTTKLLASTSEKDRQARTRNRCNGEGYESVALIPLKSGEKTIGLLQLNDKRPDCFTLDLIHFLEETGMSMGIAIARKEAMELASKNEANLRKIIEHNIDGMVVINLEGMVRFVNPATESIFGLPETALLGSPFGFPMVSSERTEIDILRPFGHGMVTAEMDMVEMEWDGEPSYLVSLHDIASRKKMEEALRNSETKYRNIFENAMEGIYQSTIEGRFITVNVALARMTGYDSPEEFKESIKDIETQIYVHPEDRKRLLAIIEEKGFVDGFEVEAYKKDGSTFWGVINARTVRDEQGEILFLEGLIEDITVRKRAEERLHQTLDSLRHAVNTTIKVLISALEARDPYTAGHQIRVADIARAIATEMGLPQDKIEGIRMAGSIHDIGKLSIPAEILSKPTKLTNIEFSLIKEHSQSGYEMLKDVESSWPLAQIVYQHHERMDGSGYPRKLKGDEILLEARIMAVADVVEAMASHRPYRPGLGIKVALEEIEKNKGIFYDNAVADACLRLFREKDYHFV